MPVLLRAALLAFLLAGAACAPSPAVPAASNPPPTATAAPSTSLAPADDDDSDGIPDPADRCQGAITGASGTDTTGCPTNFDPYVDLEFDHEAHERWYGRFWTGSCENVPGFCLPGDPAWFNVTAEIEAAFPPEQQGRIRNRLWALGRAVGYDWSSDAELSDKQVSTGKLRQWGNALQNSEDFMTALRGVEDEVCTLLGPGALEGDFSDAENCTPN